MTGFNDLKQTHSTLPVDNNNKCMFCDRRASEAICNVSQAPILLMCDQHTLFFVRGLLDDLDGVATKGAKTMTKLIEESKRREKADRAALHV